MTDHHRRKKRADITAEAVGKRWLDGATIESISIEMDAAFGTIKRRLTEARETFPDWPWDSRVARRDHGAIKRYTQMTDGQPGESVLRSGSVVRGTALRRRGR